MADSTDNWGGMASFLQQVLGGANSAKSTLSNTDLSNPIIAGMAGGATTGGGSTLDRIAMNLLNKRSSQAHKQGEITPPAQQKPVIGPAAPSAIGPGAPQALPSVAPPAPMVKPQQLSTPVMPGMSTPPMPMPAATNPITPNAGSVPQTSDPFVTGIPNPSGVQS